MGSPLVRDADREYGVLAAETLGVDESDDVEFSGFVCGFGAGFEGFVLEGYG
jgi:hypothetical protein